MTYKEDIEISIVKQIFFETLGEPLKNISPISTGKFNTSFIVTTKSGDYVLRIAPAKTEVFCFYEKDMMQQEPEIHQMLEEKTSIPVPLILAADFSGDIISRDYLIMEKIPGVPLTEAHYLSEKDLSCVYEQIGSYLRQAHDIQDNKYGYLGSHEPMEPASTWYEAFESMWSALVNDVYSVEVYSDSEVRFLNDLLSKHSDCFRHQPKSHFLHMDIWHQNILVNNSGKVTGILDWDRALWGDPEIEYAVLDYCGISHPSFWVGYGLSRPTGPEADIRRKFYLLYELQKYIVIRKGRNQATNEALSYKANVMKLTREL